MKTKTTHGSRKFTSIIATCIVAFALLALCGCGIVTETEVTASKESTLPAGSTIADGTLAIGINATNAPYGGQNSSNETVGLDVDMAAAIADELGMKLQIVNVSANGKTSLEEKRVDIVLGAVKSGSSKKLNYSSPYIYDGASLFCLTENAPADPAAIDFTDQKILTQANTASSFRVQEELGYESIIACSTMKDAFDQLVAGEAKYLVADSVIGSFFARNYSNVQRVTYITPDSVTPIYAMTLTENAELSSAVNSAVTTLSNNGVLRVIASKWLGSGCETMLPGNVDISTLTSIFPIEE